MAETRVPLLDLRQQYDSIRDDVRAAVEAVLESGVFILGPEVEALEAEVAAFCETGHAVGCGSGSDALVLALLAHGVGPGDQVLCPAFTFFATGGSVALLGAVPVFADIDPATYNLDPRAAARAAEGCDRLKAILPVHLYGRAADLDALLALAADRDVPLIEDAAQAIGTRDATGRAIGGRGSIACFSFYPTKNLGAAGEGGLLTTDDAERAERLRRLRTHGSPRRYWHTEVGMNARLDALQAAVLRVKLRHLKSWNEARRAHAEAYDRAFADAGALPSDVPLAEGGLPLRTPSAPAAPARHAYHQYVIRVPAERRDAVRARLAEQGVGTDVFYPLGLHQQPCFSSLGYREGDLPETERAAREVIALPVFAEMSELQRHYVVDAVLAALGS